VPTQHESVAKLAERLGLSAQRVLAAGLSGDLGPARIGDGKLLFRPGPDEIHNAFPSVARRCVAEAQGWDPGDTALISEVRDEEGWGWKETRNKARTWSCIAWDDAGRRYTRRSWLPPEGRKRLMTQLNGHLPSHVDPSTGSWLPLPKAAEDLGVHRMTVLKYRREGETAVRPGRGYCGQRSVYIWVDEELARRCARISR